MAIVRLAAAQVGLHCPATDCGSKVRSFGQWAAAKCTVLPTANAGQYATLICKPLLFWFSLISGIYKCIRRYINLTFYPLYVHRHMIQSHTDSQTSVGARILEHDCMTCNSSMVGLQNIWVNYHNS